MKIMAGVLQARHIEQDGRAFFFVSKFFHKL